MGVGEEGSAPSFSASGLAPVSVLPAHQKNGIGSALIKKGVEELKAKSIDACFLLGDPAYYGRFGFSVEAATPFASPYAGPYFQMLNLSGKELTPCAVAYASSFEEV